LAHAKNNHKSQTEKFIHRKEIFENMSKFSRIFYVDKVAKIVLDKVLLLKNLFTRGFCQHRM